MRSESNSGTGNYGTGTGKLEARARVRDERRTEVRAGVSATAGDGAHIGRSDIHVVGETAAGRRSSVGWRHVVSKRDLQLLVFAANQIFLREVSLAGPSASGNAMTTELGAMVL